MPAAEPVLALLLQGWACAHYPGEDLQAAAAQGMVPLLDAIVKHVPPPNCDPEGPFAMCVAMIDRDPYLGRIAPGAPPPRTASMLLCQQSTALQQAMNA